FSFISSHPSILFLDELDQIIGAGQGEHQETDVSRMMLPLMNCPNVNILAAVTPGEYIKLLSNSALMDRFQEVQMPELKETEKKEIIKAHVLRFNCLPKNFEEEIYKQMQNDISMRKILALPALVASRMELFEEKAIKALEWVLDQKSEN
ncbi:MAG: AAA family ATPase, partial [Chlamydiia bacterium]|nr:AAA family ATPase [Chlamydiia bacterium]